MTSNHTNPLSSGPSHVVLCFALLSFRTVAYTPRPNATWSLSVDCLSPSCIFAFHHCFNFVVRGFSHRPLCTRVCSLSKGANCKLQLDLLHLLVVYTIVIVCYAVHLVHREPQEQRPGRGAHALLLWHQPTQPAVCSEWQPRFLAVVDLWWRSFCWDEWSEIKEVGEREREREKRGFEERSFVLKQRSHGGSRHRRWGLCGRMSSGDQNDAWRRHRRHRVSIRFFQQNCGSSYPLFLSPLLQLASECCSCSSFRILLSNFGGRCGSPSQDRSFVEP
jgi:hypothetical protein